MSGQQRLLATCAFVMFSAVATVAQMTIQRQDVPLNSGWEFRQLGAGDNSAGWRPAQVPGDVHLDLLRNNLIPDPFYRNNEAKLQWIENADWEYRTTIQATPDLLKHKNIELVFEGLDAYAKVYLSEQLVLTADNMFREWRVKVKPVLKPGANQLRVVFPSPIKAAAEIAVTDKWREQTHTAEKTYIRKAAYEYGWDWGPRFVTSGIWRPAKLELWDAARISNLHIAQRDVTSTVAHLVAQVEVTASEDSNGKVTLDYLHAEKKVGVSRTVALHTGTNHIDFPVEIENPQLWYPAGYGAQPIYQFNAHFNAGNRTEDQASMRTGLRSIVLRRELDQWGRSFEFIINGIPVFGKGADVIPFDSFPSRITPEDYRRILQSARDANMNMIRHWGGGYYETDEFYNLCDELGIMVWQDFMFGNDWQPGPYAWKQNVEKEAEYQVRRLRDHPSIIIWCGNNETEGAFKWGGREQLPAPARLQMWQDYLTVFSGILDRVVNRLAPETPYWPSSPSSRLRGDFTFFSIRRFSRLERLARAGTVQRIRATLSPFHDRIWIPIVSGDAHGGSIHGARGPGQHLHSGHARPPEEQRGKLDHSRLHATGLFRAQGFRHVSVCQPGAASRGHQNRCGASAPQPSADHGFHFLAAQ